jgi:hypothetical protein
MKSPVEAESSGGGYKKPLPEGFQKPTRNTSKEPISKYISSYVQARRNIRLQGAPNKSSAEGQESGGGEHNSLCREDSQKNSQSCEMKQAKQLLPGWRMKTNRLARTTKGGAKYGANTRSM